MVYSRAALDASGAPSPGARASLDLGAAPYVSHISVPAHLADGMDFAAASVRATISDGLLLLDLDETLHLPPGPQAGRESLDRPMLLELSAAGAASELDAARFVCNPLSGQIFRLPVPNKRGAGAFCVDPFSDRPEHQFVELPHGSLLTDFDISDKLMLGRRRLMGVSEGKLRYVEVSTENEFVVSSFALEEGCCWNPTRETTVQLVLPNKRKPLEDDMPWIVAIYPFNANTLYFQHGHTIIAMDMDKGEVIGKMPFPDSITGLSPYDMAFFVSCVLPPWLESNHSLVQV